MDIGDSPVIQVKFYNRDGVPTNPTTVVGSILLPDGTIGRLNFAATATVGIWEATYLITQSGEHIVRYQATGTVITAGEKKFEVVVRHVPDPPATALTQMEVINRGVPVYGSPNSNQPTFAVDGVYGNLWRSITSPNGGTAVWLAMDLRSVLATKKKNIWAVMKGHMTTTFGGGVIQLLGNYLLGSQPVSNYSFLARNYKIQGHISNGTLPASNDPGWVDLVTVVDNSFHTRVHTGLDLTNYNWIRFYCTAASGVTGATDDVGMELDLRDASFGTADSIMAYGDSITEEAFGGTRPDNAFWINVGPVEDSIEVQTSRWAPVLVDGASIGWTAAMGDQYKADIIPLYPCKYVFINFGSNDANGANLDLNTVGGINSTYAKAFKASMRSIALYCVNLGKIPVIPHMPWGDLNSYSTGNIIILNQAIDQLIASTPSILAGPDFYTFFSANHNLLADHLHPTYDNAVGGGLLNGKTGYENYIQMWVDWMKTNLYT